MNANTIIEEINQIVEGMISGTIHFLPKLILVVAVLLLGWLLARLVKFLVMRFILYLDKNINKTLINRHLKIDIQSASNFIGRTFYWFIFIVTIAVVTQILGFPILTAWFGGVVEYLPNILAAIVFIFVGIISGKFINDLVVSLAARTRIPNGKALGKIAHYIILFITLIIAIGQLGINIKFLTDIIAIILAVLLAGAALAFGIGAKTSVSNILGSYYLQKTYREGNHIRISDIEGVIIKITATNIIIRTDSGQVTVPAKDFNEEKTVLVKKD